MCFIGIQPIKPNRAYKIQLMGCSGVGKSSLTNQFVTHFFEPRHFRTPGTEQCFTKVTIPGPPPKEVLLEIDDTKGTDTGGIGPLLEDAIEGGPSEKDALLGDISSMHYTSKLKPRQGFVIVYDVGSRYTFNHATSLLQQLFDRIGFNPEDTKPLGVPVFLVGNKSDLSVKEREVLYETGASFAESEKGGGILFFETSARYNDGVAEIFIRMAHLISLKETPIPEQKTKCWSKCIIL